MPQTLPKEWDAAFDPHEVKDYSNSWEEDIVATGDTLLTSLFILPSDAIAAGVQIQSQQATQYGGLAWFTVSAPQQASALWDGTGTPFRIRHQITTVMGRVLERSIYLLVVQQ